MRSLRLLVEYDGTDFAGFQRQANAPTIQGELERALAKCLQHEVSVAGAGRTDAGVHAIGQVCRVRTENRIPVDRLPLALNRLLPRTIVVRSAREAEAGWHPRYHATSRTYRYTIDNQTIPSALSRRFAYHLRAPLEVEAMQAAAQCLVGCHDFAAFQTSGSPMGSTVRELRQVAVVRHRHQVTVTVEANAFLYQMVRTLVGTLMQIGRGQRSGATMLEVLQSRDREQAGPTAPPHGLCLVRVKYDRLLRGTGERGKIHRFNLQPGQEAEFA